MDRLRNEFKRHRSNRSEFVPAKSFSKKLHVYNFRLEVYSLSAIHKEQKKLLNYFVRTEPTKTKAKKDIVQLFKSNDEQKKLLFGTESIGVLGL